jgi:peptide/nickel transport system substrate-binding protein
MPYDFHLNPMPVLAKSWEIGKDGLVWAMHRRVKVRCHEREPFTAVEAIDEMTVLLTLEEPYVRLPCSVDAIGAPTMPGHVYRGTASRNTPANHVPIGTGPFKVPVWPAGEFIHLVRNDDCWQDGKPHFDEIYYRFSPHDLRGDAADLRPRGGHAPGANRRARLLGRGTLSAGRPESETRSLS